MSIMIIEINDFDAPELDLYARLKDVQLYHYYEPDAGVFIAESPAIVERAIESGCEVLSFLCEPHFIKSLSNTLFANLPDVPVYTAPLEVMEQITGFHLTRGLLSILRRPAPRSIDEVIEGKTRVAILENTMNPTNVGAMFRSAAALGIGAVLLTPDCSDPLYRRAARVSMGTVFQVPWAYFEGPDMTWPEGGVDYLHKKGFKTIAMALSDDSISIDDPVLKQEEKLAIVMGTEGDGLTANTIATCDYTVRIPMYAGVDSLNVAAASAVAFWELRDRKSGVKSGK